MKKGICCLLVVLFLLCGCGNKNVVVASVDEFEVSYDVMLYFVRNYMRDEAAGDEGYWTAERVAERKEDIYNATFEALKQQFAVYSLCKKYDVDRNNEAITELVNAYIDAAIEEYGDEKTFLAALEEANMSEDVYRFYTTVSVCEEELYYAMLEAGTIENDDTKIQKLVNGDEFIRVKQILIASDNGKTAEENRATAEKVRDLARKGTDFDTLVKEYGEDLYMFNNKDGYYICRGVWYTAFENAAFALKVGEISDVIETSAGYSVLMRCEKEKSYLTEHMDELCNDYRDAQFSLAIEARAAEMTAVARPELEEYTAELFGIEKQ